MILQIEYLQSASEIVRTSFEPTFFTRLSLISYTKGTRTTTLATTMYVVGIFLLQGWQNTQNKTSKAAYYDQGFFNHSCWSMLIYRYWANEPQIFKGLKHTRQTSRKIIQRAAHERQCYSKGVASSLKGSRSNWYGMSYFISILIGPCLTLLTWTAHVPSIKC